VFGTLGGKGVVCMRGRFHTYEGYDIRKTSLPILVFKFLGVKLLVVTNAAGGLNPSFEVGDFMVIRDHLNIPGLAGKHPLVGKNDEKLGPRFPSTSDNYDTDMQAIAFKVGSDLGITSKMRIGTYCFVSGPTYESAAEVMFLYNNGGDAVGMSTVPETVVAHYCGIKVLGVSLITNKSIVDPDDKNVATHDEVLAAVQGETEENMLKLISKTIEAYNPAGAGEGDDAKAPAPVPPPRASAAQRLKILEKRVTALSYTVGVLAIGLLASVGAAYAAAKHMAPTCPKKK